MTRSSTVKMTARGIEKLPGPPRGSTSPSKEYTCAQQKCLVLAVFANGAKSWRLKVKFRGRRISHTFGAYPVWSVDQAIEHARKLIQLADQGIDPRGYGEDDGGMTVEAFVEEYFKPYVLRHYKSAKNAVNVLENRILPHFGAMPLTAVTKKHITEFHQNLPAPKRRK
jgi:hypothetical protein